ncbi:hypothetical protein TPHA_0L01980 [Tetrapisispora phaffii CBS 4417]|uniref:Uncharacterized protein n=1 Tax=Tetrapisispora phaffii (strain ATCC 24235 / CBS 4417 / NBRC 1672 / NRRL Y-8282 / UCD 70-5) TaxID=1071381 RepID=G8C072_TETPH|nr:hypothetical protein TPHA_0L01980 [Tetrapisispora phaffii CBS 4417]CCE65550.1 hypothetical protein TPHA_0L01980 [Tetrapisispora phaffii CBS 4417]
MLRDPSIRLRKAIIEGNVLIVKRLLRRFPELLTNINPDNGWSSLHYASFNGRYLICAFLIQMGHDRHEILKTFEQDTCVHLAILNGHEQTAHLLLQHFPQFINKKGKFGRTPVHIACLHDYNQCLSLLIGVGAQLALADDNGDIPLHICLAHGSINCLRVLILEGDSRNEQTRNKDGWKPIDVAKTFELKNLYKTLLKDVHASGINKMSTYQPFRTPVLPQKSTFEDGPSPIYSLNSPTVSLYSQANVLNNLSRISNGRRASIANNITTSLSNGGSGNTESKEDLVLPSGLNSNISNSFINKSSTKSPIARAASFTSLLTSVDPIFGKGSSKSGRGDSITKRDIHVSNTNATNFNGLKLDKPLTGSPYNLSSRKSLNYLRETEGNPLNTNHDELTQTIFKSNSNTNLFSKYLTSRNNEKENAPLLLKNNSSNSDSRSIKNDNNIYESTIDNINTTSSLKPSHNIYYKKNIEKGEDSTNLAQGLNGSNLSINSKSKTPKEKPILHRIDTSDLRVSSAGSARRKMSLLNISVAKLRKDDTDSTPSSDEEQEVNNTQLH